MRSLSSEDEYRIARHLEMRPGEDFRSNQGSKPLRKWASLAYPADDLDTFDEVLEENLVIGKKNTIFVENVVSQYRDASEIFDLLEEHVKNNMVKIGKKFYRQKQGIPQGSVLSSILCNYFYADLEANHLDFLNAGDSLLLRLVDDFLLITSNSAHARIFLQIMHDGLPKYGVRVNPAKTLVNFEVAVNGQKVQRSLGKNFPYCGSFIDTTTLDVTRDRERRADFGKFCKLKCCTLLIVQTFATL
jgi:telomerase reverse transcriptase